MSKIILVTGANRGIGFEICRQLSQSGHRVILTARNLEKGMAAKQKLDHEGLHVSFIPLDVGNKEQIIAAAEVIKQSFANLDVLINNAAVMPGEHEALFPLKEKELAEVLEINMLGPLRMMDAMISLMQRGGRIINISSGGGSMTDPVGGWAPLYCISKSALNAITKHAAYYLHEKGITVNATCPGWVKTAMGGKHAPREIQHGAETAVWLATAENIPAGKFWRDKKEIPW